MSPLSRLTFTLAVFLAPSLLSAQAVPMPAPRDSAVAPRITPTATALAVADTLMREMDLERVMQAGALATFESGIQGNPALAPLREAVKEWVMKHLVWAEVGAPMTRLYAETFTEAELRAFIAFYRTPAGRQLARLTPELAQRGAKIGADIATKHTPELERMMQAKIAEIQGGKPPE